ncbi:MAG: hypothetical protein HYZ85_03725, partial [Candidatus Omnitrophica bacterium]|nr:hypothetical protein [Candidatus Omnitrophota bacterium]
EGFDYEELLRQFRGQARPSSGRYSAFSDIFSDLFENLGGRGFTGRGRQASYGPGQNVYEFYTDGSEAGMEVPQKSEADIYVNLRISKEKAEKGGRVTFKTPEKKTLSVQIPAHTRSGQKLRLARQGRSCSSCQHEGDLILTVKVEG